MNNLQINIKILDSAKNLDIPNYATLGSAGLDLRASNTENITLKPMKRVLVPIGIILELPNFLEAQVRSRSGIALKNGVIVLNSPGTIDSDYRGEIQVILCNLSDQDFIIKRGDRIAQLVIAKFERISLNVVSDITESLRNTGSFGSTGI